MDGNAVGRKQRHLPRIEGLAKGLSRFGPSCGPPAKRASISDLYAFSVENWSRPKEEVDTLMKLSGALSQERGQRPDENNVWLEVIGQIYRLPEFVQEQLEKTRSTLSRNNGLTAVLALSYGGRQEIVEAVRDIATKVQQGKLEPDEITEQVISQHLYTKHIPDPDLLIRTSGEMRVSNFLLWQISYAELVITPTFWPDFRSRTYKPSEEYARRYRRFRRIIAR
jgi:undecaprenyl diphosphate synthase